MDLIPEHVRILSVLRLGRKQLVCRLEQDESRRIEPTLFRAGIPNEIRMYSDAAHPPVAKMVLIDAKCEEVKHSLEPSGFERRLGCGVLRTRTAIDNGHVLRLFENGLPQSRPSFVSARELCQGLTHAHRIRDD